MNRVPTSILDDTLDPHVHLFMDASNDGLCVLYPAIRQFVRVQFDGDERNQFAPEFGAPLSINVRETLSVAFAVIVWGPLWKPFATSVPVHVRCWLDNAAAVAWHDRSHSGNHYGQELARVVSCAETMFGIHVSTAHLPGSINNLADLGSRGWSGSKLDQWTNRTRTWREQVIASEYRKIYSYESSNYSGDRLPTRLVASTYPRGGSGARSAPDTVSHDGSHPTNPTTNRYSSLCLRLTAGKDVQLVIDFRPELRPNHELVLRGMHRLSPASNERGAVSFAMLTKLANSFDLSVAQHRVICGAAVLDFFFCLRGSEFLSSSGKRYRYCLQGNDVKVVDAHNKDTRAYSTAAKVILRLRGSKTDQEGKSTKRELLKSHQPPICPEHATSINAQPNAPLCSVDQGKVLSTHTMARVLRWAAVQCDQDPTHISTHSLRVGGATALNAGGVSSDTIKMHGRWVSSAYSGYIRQPSAADLQLAKRMGNLTASTNHRIESDHPRGSTRANSRAIGFDNNTMQRN